MDAGLRGARSDSLFSGSASRSNVRRFRWGQTGRICSAGLSLFTIFPHTPAECRLTKRVRLANIRLTGSRVLFQRSSLTTTFAQLQLIEPIQRALIEEKYTVPTPIQQRTIPEALAGRDILGCAQTGTGKTAAFALPILNHFAGLQRKPVAHRPLALVLAPTRELAIQIGENCSNYGRHLKVRQAVIYGGVGQAAQVQSLNHGLHLLIATPGRLLDLMQQGYVKLDQLQIFVLDEADRMMDMGFLPDLRRIIAVLPEKRQSLFFSATLPDEIAKLAHKLLRNPVTVSVTPPSSTVELIDQQVLFVERHQKRAVLLKILNSGTVGQTLVFTKTKRGANLLADQLCRHGINATAIHGNKSQNARQRALDGFRGEKIQVLVATDLAARGIDVDGITHVINFDVPHEPESYVHRIGRTGRAGETGIAMTLCDSSERADMQAIQKLIGRRIPVVSGTAFQVSEAESDPQPARRGRGAARGPIRGSREVDTAQAPHSPSETTAATEQRRSGRGPRRQTAAVRSPAQPTQPARSQRGQGQPTADSDPFGDGVFISESSQHRSSAVGSTGTGTGSRRSSHATSKDPQRTSASDASGSRTSSRRPYGRRPDRKATEEYKASGGRKSAAPPTTSQGGSQGESADSGKSRRRTRRPGRNAASSTRPDR